MRTAWWALPAHGVASREDLPIPFGAALAGAVAAVLVTFVVARARPASPERGADRHGFPLPRLTRALDAAGTRTALRVLGVVVAAYALLGLLGPDVATNPLPGVVYVLVWVGVPLLSALVGPVWRVAGPARGLLGSLPGLRSPDRPLPRALGTWPAAGALLAFTWLELVAPDGATLVVLRLAVAAYAAWLLLGVALTGRRWLAAADGVEVWSAVAASVAPLGRRADGLLGLRTPVAGLVGARARAGLTAVLCVLLGSTAYDSAAAHAGFARFVQESRIPPVLAGTAGLLVAVTLVGVTYRAAVTLSARAAGRPARGLADRLAVACLAPIAVGYVVAHYLTLLVQEGQRTLALLSDPLVRGDDWLGLRDLDVSTWLVQRPALVATIQVAAVVVGHVVGVLATHERAGQVLGGQRAAAAQHRSRAAAAQLPLLAVMVLYTVGGLLLLFAA